MSLSVVIPTLEEERYVAMAVASGEGAWILVDRQFEIVTNVILQHTKSEV